jgi:hypothetical protein
VVREGCGRSVSQFSYTRFTRALRSRPHRFSGGGTSALGRVWRARIQAYSNGRLRPGLGRARNGLISLEEAQRSGLLVCQRP